LPAGGWRAVAARDGCGLVAAELIALWRQRHIEELAHGQLKILWWHEGQVLAEAGDYTAAVDRLRKAREFRDSPPPADAPAEEIATWKAMTAVREGWEDANIAFLRRDRAALVAARDRMIAVPEPDAYRALQDVLEERTGQRMAWPLNIESVERMIACFDHRYGVECRKEK